VCRGKAQAMKRPKGYARSLVWVANVGRSRKFPHVSLTYSPARGSNTGPGPRREKNVLIVAPATAKKRPMKRDRTVKAVCGGKRQWKRVSMNLRLIVANLAFLGHPCSTPKPELRGIGCLPRDHRFQR
jgi:hypothetical protein